MEYKFIYIDDNSAENARGIITGLESANSLSIKFENHKSTWELERTRLLSEEFRTFDGLIIDLNLEQNPNKELARAQYKGSTVTQELRNLSKDGEIKEIPVILLSASTNLLKYFDRTNEDLFDIIIHREDLNDQIIFEKTRHQLIALAEGYKFLASIQTTGIRLSEILSNDLSNEDIRFVTELQSLLKSPIHTIARFMVKDLFEKPGILINEAILSARLGIDYENSEDWQPLLDILEPFRYRGVFQLGWKRWWMRGIENWWSVELQNERSLRSLNAQDRVEFLKKKLNLHKLNTAKHSPKSEYQRFWTICAGSGVPLDPRDGILIAGQDNLFSWQDRTYISIDEALIPQYRSIWKDISPLEEDRLQNLKRKFPNIRNGR